MNELGVGPNATTSKLMRRGGTSPILLEPLGMYATPSGDVLQSCSSNLIRGGLADFSTLENGVYKLQMLIPVSVISA